MRELLEAGVHFGHQTRRWNPKMRRYIFAERGGIYIIDLTKTLELLEEAHDFARNIAERRGTILFVGTKKQAQEAVQEHATRVDMPYVSNRWLGGLLTNWRTISERIAYLHDLRRMKTDSQLDLLPSKERISMEAELEKLEANLGGVADMKRQPDAVFVIDLKKEQLAVREARRLGIPILGLVDTNADPDEVDFVIPGNDDAIRASNLVTKVVADGIAAGTSKVSPQEFTPPPPAEASNGAVPEAEGDAGDAAAATAAATEPQPAAAAAQSEQEPAAQAAQSEPRGEAAQDTAQEPSAPEGAETQTTLASTENPA
jgi:small subunit ribosomal protein S2